MMSGCGYSIFSVFSPDGEVLLWEEVFLSNAGFDFFIYNDFYFFHYSWFGIYNESSMTERFRYSKCVFFAVHLYRLLRL